MLKGAYSWDLLGDASVVQLCRAAAPPFSEIAVELQLHEVSQHRCEDHLIVQSIGIVLEVVKAIVASTAAQSLLAIQ